MRNPVVVIASVAAAEHYVLIDGHARIAALGRVGGDTAQALCVALGAPEAPGWSYRLESGQRRTALLRVKAGKARVRIFDGHELVCGHERLEDGAGGGMNRTHHLVQRGAPAVGSGAG